MSWVNVDVPGYEKVIRSTGPIDVIVALHSTLLGTGIGGCRIMPYSNSDDALTDALNLSKGMTLKTSIAGLDLGGGKAVINLQPGQDKKEALRLLADMVNSLQGSYLTAQDVGTTVADIEYIAQFTKYVATLKGSGDPSPVTAMGVFESMLSSWQYLGNSSIENATVLVQGLGKVGLGVAAAIKNVGGNVLVYDVNTDLAQEVAKKLNATVVDNIFDCEYDVFAPCAVGGIINSDTIDQFKCKLVCGAANNQLLTESMDDELLNRNILYAPDFLINSGGVINASSEMTDGVYSLVNVKRRVGAMVHKLLDVYKESKNQNVGTNSIALQLAVNRLREKNDQIVI